MDTVDTRVAALEESDNNKLLRIYNRLEGV